MAADLVNHCGRNITGSRSIRGLCDDACTPDLVIRKGNPTHSLRDAQFRRKFRGKVSVEDGVLSLAAEAVQDLQLLVSVICKSDAQIVVGRQLLKSALSPQRTAHHSFNAWRSATEWRLPTAAEGSYTPRRHRIGRAEVGAERSTIHPAQGFCMVENGEILQPGFWTFVKFIEVDRPSDV